MGFRRAEPDPFPEETLLSSHLVRGPLHCTWFCFPSLVTSVTLYIPEPRVHVYFPEIQKPGYRQCRVLKGARLLVLGECVATYSGRLAVARVFIR